jgi:processive 1,2-diacylglycerol beta-glucosyltransferase
MKKLGSIMSKKFLAVLQLLFIIAPIEFAYAANKEPNNINELSKRKKILILTSFGGGGNLTASNALQEYLQNTYNVESKYVFKELLASLDPFNFLTFGRYSCEEIYNIFVPGKFFTFLGWMYQLGGWYIHLQKNRIYTLLHNYFAQTKPDLIVSVVPMINNIILEAAQNLHIPFLLMPTDLDISPYTMKINHPTYDQFYLGLAFDDQKIMTLLDTISIPQKSIFTLGAPLRKDFFTKKNRSLLRKKYDLDQNKFVIMILMGSQGSSETEKYVAELLKLTKPAHLLVCIGKNEASRENIAKLSVPEHISLSVVGFTPNIADYMAVSDIFISKSGTLSVFESLYMNLPIFIDATSTALPWEKFNLTFIKNHGFGECIEQYDQIVPLVTECIQNPQKIETYKNNIEKLEKKIFPQEARKLIEDILKDKNLSEN